MNGLKQAVFSAVASLALVCLPITPAAAHEHYHGGPCIVGNVIGAVATLITLPLAVASAAVSALQPQAQYAPAPGYYGGPAGYAPPNYNAQPPSVLRAVARVLRPASELLPARACLCDPDAALLRTHAWLLCSPSRLLWLLWCPGQAGPIEVGKKHRRAPPPKARHGGRPPRAAALELRDRILEVATGCSSRRATDRPPSRPWPGVRAFQSVRSIIASTTRRHCSPP